MTRLQRSSEVLIVPLDGDLLMLNIPRSLYHRINDVGARVWELLEHPTTEEAIVDKLLEEFDVSREVCATEVSNFLTHLRDRRLLIFESAL